MMDVMDVIVGKVFVKPSDLDLIDEYALSLPDHQLAYNRIYRYSLWVSLADLGRLIFDKDYDPKETLSDP